jgi:hypothetical protein
MQGILSAVLAFVYVVVAVAVLYRVISRWLAGDEVDSLHLVANALNALVVFAVLGILHSVAAWYGVVPPLKLP